VIADFWIPTVFINRCWSASEIPCMAGLPSSEQFASRTYFLTTTRAIVPSTSGDIIWDYEVSAGDGRHNIWQACGYCGPLHQGGARQRRHGHDITKRGALPRPSFLSLHNQRHQSPTSTTMNRLIIALKIGGTACLGILTGVHLNFSQETLRVLTTLSSASNSPPPPHVIA
jgi:hypothetical protein